MSLFIGKVANKAILTYSCNCNRIKFPKKILINFEKLTRTRDNCLTMLLDLIYLLNKHMSRFMGNK